MDRPQSHWRLNSKPGPEVIKLFSCSTQLSIKCDLLINLKLLTIANYFLLKTAEHEDFFAYKYKNANLLAETILCSAESSMKKVLYPWARLKLAFTRSFVVTVGSQRRIKHYLNRLFSVDPKYTYIKISLRVLST